MLKDVKADAWLTGEASHHELLATTAKGTHVILSACHILILIETDEEQLTTQTLNDLSLNTLRRD